MFDIALKWLAKRGETVKEATGINRFFIVATIWAILRGLEWIYVLYLHGKLPKFQSGAGEEGSIIFGLAWWGWWIIIGLLLLFWWTLEYATKLRVRKEEGKSKLAKLRTEGVMIRHDGCLNKPNIYIEVKDTTSLEMWIKKADEWNKEVITSLREINEAAGEWFSVLDSFPLYPEIDGVNVLVDESNPEIGEKHFKALRNHCERVKRLGELVREGLLDGDR